MDHDRHDRPDPQAIMTFADSDPAENPWVAGRPTAGRIVLEAYSPEWAKSFDRLRSSLERSLADVALSITHIGSTAVPELLAKPVIDIDLIVGDPEREDDYVPALTALGYALTVRERSWYGHRMLRHDDPRVNLHVFGPGCPEHVRHVLFRDWLCSQPADRRRYADVKIEARSVAGDVQAYNRMKQSVVRDIYRSIFVHRGWV